MIIPRGAWIDIYLDNILYNVDQVRELVKSDCGRDIPVMPVIKGGAYGHGIYEVAETLYRGGVDRMAVAVYTEAVLARKAAPGAMILILGYTASELFDGVVENDISQCIYTMEQAEAISESAVKLGKIARIHIKLDTGMHRLGFDGSDESAETVAAISKLPGVKIEGIFTHFATSAMTEKSYVHVQYERYSSFMKKLESLGVDVGIKHISNTGIILDSPEYNQDMVRFGSMTYGTFSSPEVQKGRVNLKEAFALRARVAHVKELDAGMGIGYDLTYVTDKPSRIVTLPIGYADIGIRPMRNTGYVLIKGQKAPVVGGICMDQMMVDATGIDVQMGDVATLIGQDGDEVLTLEQVGEWSGTDDYGIVISANHRLPRVYHKDGEIYRVVDINTVLADYYSRPDIG